jgi:hypothetical protein
LNDYYPVGLYGCETWSLGLRRVFEKMALRIISGRKGDVITGNCDEALYNLYSSPNILRITELRKMG